MKTRSLAVLTMANIILEAKNSASSIKLRNEDGREQVVKP